MIHNGSLDPGSFRDPSGFIFFKNNNIYRQINIIYKDNYDHLMDSGLYDNLVKNGMLIPHEETDLNLKISDDAYKIIKPEPIQFVSYPYEWCFSQLKDAALLTINILKSAMKYGMTLKDCSAYNIQFKEGRPIFIDTISLIKYTKNQVFVGYRQFCQHFVAPLALMNHLDLRMNQLLRIFLDGIPLDITSSLLPIHTYLRMSFLMHIHMHARSQKRFSDTSINAQNYKLSHLSYNALIDSLEACIKKMTCNVKASVWSEYYSHSYHPSDYVSVKEEIVSEFINEIKPETVWDLGANTGHFSRLASDKGIKTISFDFDTLAVEKNYIESTKRGDRNILPLMLDFTNPSPGLGWENEERMSLFKRGPTDAVLVLALIHHLAISNNIPLGKIAASLHKICRWLIIEFVPKSDPQVKKLLSSREDIFDRYDSHNFEIEFKKYFNFCNRRTIPGSERVLFLLKGISCDK